MTHKRPGRYYAECLGINPIYKSSLMRAWMVFDRDQIDLSEPNNCHPIALCNNRASAFLIRDALNGKEE